MIALGQTLPCRFLWPRQLPPATDMPSCGLMCEKCLPHSWKSVVHHSILAHPTSATGHFRLLPPATLPSASSRSTDIPLRV